MAPRPSQRTAKHPAACPRCGGKDLHKRGVRNKKLETVQLWQCKSCNAIWTPETPDAQDKTYTPRIIKDALISYCLGRSLAQTRTYIAAKRGIKRSPSTATIARYLKEYAHLLSIRRIREELLSTPIQPPFATIREDLEPYPKYSKPALYRPEAQ